MKKIFLFPILIAILLLNSCNNDRLIIDVSDIEVNLNVLRFDKEFLPIDTMNSSEQVAKFIIR